MGKNTAILGGLMKGVGDSMVSDAAQKRDDALARAKLLADSEEKDKAREHDSGLLSKTVTDESGNIYGVDKSGKASELGIKTAPPKGGKGSGKGYLSPDDKRLLDATVKRHTTNSGLAGEVVDWDAVAETLRDQGREDLANLNGPPKGDSKRIDVQSPEYREAKRQAAAWVEEQADAMGFDSDDFKDYGGNREEARKQKTLEIYRELKGQGGAQKAPPVADKEQPAADPAATAAKTPPGSKPAGGGTKDSPYKAVTQADIDWFKAKAPSGSVIMVNGKPYTK